MADQESAAENFSQSFQRYTERLDEASSVHKNDEFCITNDELCIENDEFCIKNDEL